MVPAVLIGLNLKRNFDYMACGGIADSHLAGRRRRRQEKSSE
jgi:hypothetical protein